jgi:hypothetical protein
MRLACTTRATKSLPANPVFSKPARARAGRSRALGRSRKRDAAKRANEGAAAFSSC